MHKKLRLSRGGWLEVGVSSATAFLRAAGCTQQTATVFTPALAPLSEMVGRTELGGEALRRAKREDNNTGGGIQGGEAAHHDIVAAATHCALVVAAYAVGAADRERFVRRQVSDDGPALAEEREPRRPQGERSLRPHLIPYPNTRLLVKRAAWEKTTGRLDDIYPHPLGFFGVERHVRRRRATSPRR